MIELIWFLVATATTIICLMIHRARYNSFDLFAPGISITLILAIGYLAPFPGTLAETDTFREFWPIDLTAPDEAIAGSLQIYCVTIVALLAGCATSRRSNHVRGPISSLPAADIHAHQPYVTLWGAALTASIVLFLIGVHLLGGPAALASGLGDRIRLFAGLNYFFLPVNIFVSASLLLAVSYLRERKRTVLLTWGAVFALSIAFAAVLGNKSNIFIALLATVTVFHYTARRLSMPLLLAAGLLLWPALMAYQLYVREYLPTGELMSIDASTPIASFFEYCASQLSGNIMQLQTLSILVDQMPNALDYQFGKTFASLLTLPIPSSIYPDKPLTAPGVFTLALWPHRWIDEGTTLPPGIVGELYMNFGVIGVAAGAFLAGSLFERTYLRLASVNAAKPASLAIYAILIASVTHYVRGEFVSPTLLVLSMTLPILFIEWVAKHWRTA